MLLIKKYFSHITLLLDESQIIFFNDIFHNDAIDYISFTN